MSWMAFGAPGAAAYAPPRPGDNTANTNSNVSGGGDDWGEAPQHARDPAARAAFDFQQAQLPTNVPPLPPWQQQQQNWIPPFTPPEFIPQHQPQHQPHPPPFFGGNGPNLGQNQANPVIVPEGAPEGFVARPADLALGVPVRTLWVGNVSPYCTEDDLRSAFAPFGSLEHVRMFGAKNCAFVRFQNLEDAMAAHARMHGQVVSGQEVRVGWGKDSGPPPSDRDGGRTGGPSGFGGGGGERSQFGGQSGGMEGGAGGFGQSRERPSRNLWVGNLAREVGENELQRAFERFGQIERIKSIHNKNCAFVMYATQEQADRAVAEMHGSELAGSILKINYGREPTARDLEKERNDSAVRNKYTVGIDASHVLRAQTDEGATPTTSEEVAAVQSAQSGGLGQIPPPPMEALPPDDPEMARMVDVLAKYVAENGHKFEELIRERQRGNPKFSFLKTTHASHQYYRWTLWTKRYPDIDPFAYTEQLREAKADAAARLRVRMHGGGRDDDYSGRGGRDDRRRDGFDRQSRGDMHDPRGFSREVIGTQAPRSVDITGPPLDPDQRQRLDETVRTLAPTKESIHAAKMWVLSIARGANSGTKLVDICTAFARAAESAPNFERALNVLYLVHDILIQCGRVLSGDLGETGELDRDAARVLVSAWRNIVGRILAATYSLGAHDPENRQSKPAKVLSLWNAKRVYSAAELNELASQMRGGPRAKRPADLDERLEDGPEKRMRY